MKPWFTWYAKAALVLMTFLQNEVLQAQPVKVDVSFSTSGSTEAHNTPSKDFHSQKATQIEVTGQEKLPCSSLDAAKSNGSAYAGGELVKKDDFSVGFWLVATASARGGKFEQCARCSPPFCDQPTGPMRTEGRARSEARANISYQFGESVLSSSLKSFRILITVLDANTEASKLKFTIKRTGLPSTQPLQPDVAFDFTPRPNEELILGTGLVADVRTIDETNTKRDELRVKLRIDITEAPVLEAAMKDGYILKGKLTEDHESVGMLALASPSGVLQPHCTGTVVGSSSILTAAHCVHSEVIQKLVATGKFLFVLQPKGREPMYLPIKSLVFPAGEEPEKYRFREHFTHYYEDDIAVLSTEQVIGLNSVKLYEGMPTLDSVVKSKAELTFVGYGLDPASSTEAGAGVKRSATIPLVTVDNFTMFYTSAAGSSTCNGDSGGPAFLRNGETYELVGVTSYGAMNCKQGRSMRVDRYVKWIKARIN